MHHSNRQREFLAQPLPEPAPEKLHAESPGKAVARLSASTMATTKDPAGTSHFLKAQEKYQQDLRVHCHSILRVPHPSPFFGEGGDFDSQPCAATQAYPPADGAAAGASTPIRNNRWRPALRL